MNKLEKVEGVLKVVKAQEEAGLAKAKSILGDVKLGELDIPEFLKKAEPAPKKKKCNVCVIIAIILGIVAVAAVIYGLYVYFTPDYLDDFDDDFEDDDFEDDDFFEDEDKE